ncbi:hypothetical protein [Campylobacter ureolyticus]|uniref:hypothetical protein n=1 Tax=Campylobacter ureolyticus TaxID=827 RepID=UPI001FC8E6CE|nr:hypothetical protein [Campylobacter ureolyticus]MCZ6106205.1 hypothetical protein [Campylobacter ureolyticus]MCZ6157580.1 hypothetical protein [Campylobacter ureolyticus]GKH60865.1 hypothetical protein CE91St25_12010 [Campylobacter ureolyticus]
MAEDLTQEQLEEWGYLKEQELVAKEKEPSVKKYNAQNNTQKSELEENEEKEKQVQKSFNRSNEKLNKDTRKALGILSEKLEINEQIKDRQDELNEIKNPRITRDKVKDSINELESNEVLKESLDILKEKEKIDEQIKEKEEQIKNNKKESTKIYEIYLYQDTGGDNYGEIEELKLKGSKQEIMKYYLENKEIENSRQDGYGNSRVTEFKIYDENGKNVTKEIKEEIKKEADKTEKISQEKQESEQIDWNKKADELELQHEKELEDLKDKQSRLEANFQKSIDNLMNSDGITGVITALQEMDRSLEIMLKQGKEESEAKNRQRAEKLELAFDSPKFKDAVSNLVKEVYDERKKVKGGLDEMEKERSNFAKLSTTYDKLTKNKELDLDGYQKLKKMMDNIEKETPNFKNTYPKMHKKVSKTLEKEKENILNKTLNKTKDQEKDRSLEREL